MEEKLKALLIGLDIQDIPRFIWKAEAEDYLKLGRAYREASKNVKTESIKVL